MPYVMVLGITSKSRKEWCYVARTFSCASTDLLPTLETHTLGCQERAAGWRRHCGGQACSCREMRAAGTNTDNAAPTPVLTLGKEKPHMVFSSDFFSIARCLTFSYFFLIVSRAIGCWTCFFYLRYVRQNKVQSFFFSSNLNGRETCFVCVCVFARG